MDKQEIKKLQIRNSTVDFLVFTKDSGESGIEVRVQGGTVWLTQKGISQLFDADRSVITKHLKNIYAAGELDEKQLVQNLHKLLITDAPINICFIRCLLSFLSAIVSILSAQRNSGSGPPRSWTPLRSKAMYWTRTG